MRELLHEPVVNVKYFPEWLTTITIFMMRGRFFDFSSILHSSSQALVNEYLSGKPLMLWHMKSMEDSLVH